MEHQIPLVIGLLYIAFWFALFFLVVIYKVEMTDVQINPGDYLVHFEKEHINSLLAEITSVGKSCAGSDLETLFQKLIAETKSLFIDQGRLDLFNINYDVVYSNGSYETDKTHTIFKNVPNLIIRVQSTKQVNKKALLVVATFESAVYNDIWIATVFEALRILLEEKEGYEAPLVIFITAGGHLEKCGLHAFVNSHKWFRDIS